VTTLEPGLLRWRLPLLAAVGASLLLVVAVNRWGAPSDEHAYWLAARRLLDGMPLYDPSASVVTPFVYLYPPPLAQVLVPVVALVPSWLFSILWTVGMVLALWWLAGRDLLRMFALAAFPPVAVEFWFRNVHLYLAVLVVLGLRHWPPWLAIGAGVKLSPGLGIAYLAGRGLWRQAALAMVVGSAVLLTSVILSPAAWSEYLRFVLGLDPMARSAFIPVAFPIRVAGALILVALATRLDAVKGQVLLVAAVTLALPSLWFTGLSLLAAIVPVVRSSGTAK
jgi:hypothetical protein